MTSSVPSSSADVARAPTQSAGEDRHRYISLRFSLYGLVVACAFPALAMTAYLVWENHRLERQRAYAESILLARKVSADLDRELSAIESGLKVLATSEHLTSGDLRRFHQQAREAAATQIVYNYVLTDAMGRQVLNTIRPYGVPLPETGTPAELQRVFTERATVLADLFIGPVVKRPALAMGVPVWIEGEVRYSLNIGLDPEALSELLRREPLPPDWLLVILDRSAAIVARSRLSERFVGQKAVPAVQDSIRLHPEASIETVTKEGIPAISSHHRSDLWGWTVAVGLPKASLERELMQGLAWLLGVSVFTIALGMLAALRIGRRVLTSVAGMNAAALAISRGEPVVLPEVRFQEAQAVGEAIVKASRAMSDVRHLAHHDPLTGLANRRLFSEIAQNQLAAARRQQSGLVILALDLDNFKAVNDTHGHAVGDELLRTVAARLRAGVRDTDVPARVGGDEFLVLMQGADAALAAEVAQRLIQTISEPYPGVGPRISVSVGVAVFPVSGQSVDELMFAADAALYEAKHAGRGCYRIDKAAAQRSQ